MRRDLKDLSKLWPWLRPSRGWLIFAVFLIPVISGVQMSLPLVLKYTIDHGIAGSDMTGLFTGAGMFLGLVVLEYVARSSQSLASAIAVHRMIRALRRHVIGHVLKLAPSFHDRSMSGALVTRATSDFDNLSESLNMGVLTSVVDCAVLLGCLIGMFVLNWQLALIALIMLPLVGWIVAAFSRGLKSAMLAARKEIAQLNAWTQECLYGNTTIKLLNAEGESAERYAVLNVAYRNAQMRSVVLDAMMFAVLDGIASITVGLVLWFAIMKLTGAVPIHAAVSAGVLVAFVQYVQQLFEPMKQLGNKMAMLQGAFTSIDRVFGLLGENEFIAGSKSPPLLTGDLEFRNVSFTYRRDAPGAVAPDKSRPTLTDVSFTMRAGESLALVGATGSGKSTIIKLLTRLYDGYTGDILVSGEPLSALSPILVRQQMAIVPQDIVLFDGSIEFNISLGTDGITREQVVAAAKLVRADRFIDRLEGTYDFQVREQGANLSHGQRQLIAFARALVRRPRIIVLDEATSSIDPESERMIQEAIDVILKGHSVIVIAHRLSTIERCDRIVVLGNGRVLESGRHSELLARKSAYFQLQAAAHGGNLG